MLLSSGSGGFGTGSSVAGENSKSEVVSPDEVCPWAPLAILALVGGRPNAGLEAADAPERMWATLQQLQWYVSFLSWPLLNWPCPYINKGQPIRVSTYDWLADLLQVLRSKGRTPTPMS